MADSRLTLTISAQNLASQAFKQLQTDIRQSNEHLEQIANNTRKVTRATVNLTASQQIVKRLRGEYNLLRTEVANTAAVTRQFSTVLNSHIRAQIEAAANIERLRVGLVSISGSVSAASKQYERLVEVSRLPGINIENSLRATLQLQAIGKSGEEAVEVIREFGNAFALAGGSGRQLGGVVHGIRQIISDGSVLQRELNIITSRIALLTPIMEEAFGGNRAEDVRAFAESIGRGDDVVDVFFETILAGLKELPRAGDTAANAIENLGDTTQRVQAVIGANFLPLVRETTAAAESFLMEIEREPQIAKTIAILEALGGTFLTVTAAGVGLAAALPALIAAIASLGAPILIPIAAVAALTAGLVALKVASRDIETQVEQLAATFDELDTALRKNHEAIQSNQQAQVESAKSSLTTQRDAIQKHITLLEEEQASIERTIEANQRRAEQGLLPIASTGESFTTQLDNANARLDVTQKRLQEVNDALRANEEASIPIQKTTANIGTLTKAVTRLKTELEEETTFEGISQSITGGTANFQKSATALADIEVLIKQNADAFEDLGKSAASGNQEAAKSLADLNKQLDGIRDTQADRHIDNLSAAFNRLTSATDPSRKQLEAILKSAEAFVATFQGGAAVLQDDVGRASELIGNIRSQLQDLSSDEITLELHAEEAEDLTRALTDFHDLQRDVQEDAGLDAQQSAEKQATAYIRAYRDTIDPAILNLVESVKLLREEVRGSIQDLETLNLRDELRIELNAENLSPVADFFTELVDLQQAAQGYLTRSQIDSLEKRSQALRQYLLDDTAHFVAYASDIEAIDETLTDKSLSLLEGAVQAREALFRDEARTQRQVEQAKRQENEKTYDFDVYLAGLRTKNRHAASQDLIRIEERALDASSQSQRENLIRETQQFVDEYDERGEAFRDLVADAQDLGAELQQAFDLSEQTRRLEDFRDGVADVLQDLASVAVDHIFDGFFGAVDEATAAIQTFTDVFRGDIELLENDVTRLARQVEDAKIRLSRLGEDESRRIRQLERQRRSLLARASTGDQKNAERTRQRAQDISFRISDLREDFDVRRRRTQEDADLRRNRAIADAEGQRDRALARQEGDSLLSEIQASLTDATVNALSGAIASGLGGLLSSPLEKIAGFLAGGLASSLGDLFGGLFGGEGAGTPTTPQTPQEQQQGDGDGTGEGDADVTGNITKITVDPDLATPSVDVAGLIKSAVQAAEGQYTIPTINAKGRITTAELSEGAALPSVPGLKGGIDNIVLQMNASLPLVPGLTGQVGTLDLAETIEDLPNIAGLEGRIDALTLSTEAATGLSVSVAGIINALTLEGTLPTVTGLTGTVEDVLISPDIDPPSVDGLHGIISTVATSLVSAPQVNVSGLITSLSLLATAPALEGLTAAIEDVALSPDIDPPSVSGLAGRIDSVTLDPDVDLPAIRISATAVVGSVAGGQGGGRVGFSPNEEEDPENPRLDGEGLVGAISSLSIDPAALAAIQPVMISGVIKPVLDLSAIPDPIVLRGRIDATVNYLTGANIDQDNDAGERSGGGGQGRPANRDEDQDPVQRSQVAQDLSTIANVLQNAAVSGNLNPELGPTPRVDIPTPNLDVDDQPSPGAAHPEGFGDTLKDTDQFAPRAGGGGRAGVSGALRVTFPTEVLSKLAQEETLSKQFVGANQHLAIMRTFIANEMFPSLNTQLTEITDALNSIRIATEKTAEAPLVERLVDAGVAFPNDPQDPTNAALTQSPIQDILSQGGLSLLAGFDNIDKNLQTLLDAQSQAQGTPDLSVIPGTDPSNPMYIVDVNRDTPRKVEIVNTPKMVVDGGVLDGVRNPVDVKQVGVVQVTQGGEFVVQLAGGGTIPVRVEGGRMVVDIAGGLEGLAVNLADTEVGLRAVGAI